MKSEKEEGSSRGEGREEREGEEGENVLGRTFDALVGHVDDSKVELS